MKLCRSMVKSRFLLFLILTTREIASSQTTTTNILGDGKREGHATNTHSCDTIRNEVPKDLTFITKYGFYHKYTEAYGIPIVSSERVSDRALKRACHITRFLFADRYDVRDAFYKYTGRFAVVGINEKTTDLPEHSNLPSWYNIGYARGLGATLVRPFSSGGEENILCLKKDRYYKDDIFFHEAAHGVAEVGLAGGVTNLYERLKRLYIAAKRAGKWNNTYSITNHREYFAEGMQSYFNNHREGPNPPNGVHGPVNTNSELKEYDTGLYNLIKELFPCENTYHWCSENAAGSNLKMNCPVTKQPDPIGYVKATSRPICYKATGRSPGIFKIPMSGKIIAIKLEH
uniref:Uncharacterized protein n=1 Tax=Clytia hemisphaerica TaxID=252671 RepID=A0A7M5V838_9CNID